MCSFTWWFSLFFPPQNRGENEIQSPKSSMYFEHLTQQKQKTTLMGLCCNVLKGNGHWDRNDHLTVFKTVDNQHNSEKFTLSCMWTSDTKAHITSLLQVSSIIMCVFFLVPNHLSNKQKCSMSYRPQVSATALELHWYYSSQCCNVAKNQAFFFFFTL